MRTVTWIATGIVASVAAWTAGCGDSPPQNVVVALNAGATPSGPASAGPSGSATPSDGLGTASTGPATPSNSGASTPDSGAFSLIAVGGQDAGSTGGQDAGSSSGDGGHAGGTSSGDGGGTGVPCDIATYFAQACTSCHGNPPLASALAGLVTYSDLMATAKEDPTKNEAQLSLARMQNAASPMPPSGVAPAADVTSLQNWINAGYPKGSCDGGSAPPPPPPPKSVFTGAPAFVARAGSNSHNAGQDCIGCHTHAGSFTIGGTLYDGSGKPVGSAEVRVVDANNVAFSVYTGSNGTFHSSQRFTAPAHIGVRDATHTLDMITALQSGAQAPAPSGGACGGCHCSGAGCTVAAVHLP